MRTLLQSRRRISVCGLLALAAALEIGLVPASLFGDIVYLKSGRSIEGTTSPGKKPGTLEIRTNAGIVVTISQDEIERIERRPSPAEEVEARLRAIPEGDLAALHDLLAFARDKRLRKQARAIAERILEIDGDDEAARRELGYVVYENRWVPESELRNRPGLVYHAGQWMSLEEKRRLEKEAARREILELFELAESSNPYVQEFAIRKILARKDEVAREVFFDRIADPRKIPRMIAIRGLLHFPVKGPGDETSRKAARELHRLALEEKSPEVLKVLYATLARFHPAENFRLALDVVKTSASSSERSRAAEVLYYTLRKSLVPELCRAVSAAPAGPGRPEVRDVLRRALGADFGFDPAAWLRYWEEHQAEFTDD